MKFPQTCTNNFDKIVAISSFEDSSYYNLKECHTVGISILPEYYKNLQKLSKKNFDAFLKYLYYKFHKKIIKSKVAPYKRTATTTYQPPTKTYINIRLKNISPYIWEKYWDLRKITGYSISYIIRQFLEWELESINKSKEQNQLKKEFSSEKEINIVDLNAFEFNNSYVLKKEGCSHKREIKLNYRDEFY